MTEAQGIGLALMVGGAFFNLCGCIGLVRLPDLYNRLQAATKCVTLGTCLLLAGACVHQGFGAIGVKALVCILFVFITSPTAAHALSRGAYRGGVKLWEKSVVDEYGKSRIAGAGSAKGEER
jgi:multicomponent Na+:H+ antiporter subunit G